MLDDGFWILYLWWVWVKFGVELFIYLLENNKDVVDKETVKESIKDNEEAKSKTKKKKSKKEKEDKSEVKEENKMDNDESSKLSKDKDKRNQIFIFIFFKQITPITSNFNTVKPFVQFPFV